MKFYDLKQDGNLVASIKQVDLHIIELLFCIIFPRKILSTELDGISTWKMAQSPCALNICG
jgi:hypothetical protein